MTLLQLFVQLFVYGLKKAAIALTDLQGRVTEWNQAAQPGIRLNR
jgi:hypothetical protein